MMLCRLTETLKLVVGDLVPHLPADFNVMAIYQEAAYKKIREDVTNYFVTNKNTLPVKELFQLVAFTQFQVKILSKHGVDTSTLCDLAEACHRQLEVTCQTQLASQLPKFGNDEKVAPTVTNFISYV
jgi:hypothetical protein